MHIESLVSCGIAATVAYGLFKWINNPKIVTSDPWGSEVEQLINDPHLEPLCHRCFTPQSHEAWFCPACGASVGPYNNYMPYVYVFPQGEVLRAGVHDHIRWSVLTIAGYILLSFSCYLVFAPIYWYFLFRNFKRHSHVFEYEA